MSSFMLTVPEERQVRSMMKLLLDYEDPREAPENIDFTLELNGPIKKGTPNPFAGNLVFTGTPPGQTVNGVVITPDEGLRGQGNVACTFMVCGLGVRIQHDSVGYTQLGYAMPTPAGVVDRPGLTNIGPLSIYRNAIVRKGIDAEIAKMLLFLTQQIELDFGCRSIQFEERITNIGESGEDTNLGSGTMLADSVTDIAAANLQSAANGKGWTFFTPPNSYHGFRGAVENQLAPAQTTRMARLGQIHSGVWRGKIPIPPRPLMPWQNFKITMSPALTQDPNVALLGNVITDTGGPQTESAMFSGNTSQDAVIVTTLVAGLVGTGPGAPVIPIGVNIADVWYTAAGVAQPPLVRPVTTATGAQACVLNSFFSLGATTFTPGEVFTTVAGVATVTPFNYQIGPDGVVTVKYFDLLIVISLLGSYCSADCLFDYLANYSPPDFARYYINANPWGLGMAFNSTKILQRTFDGVGNLDQFVAFREREWNKNREREDKRLARLLSEREMHGRIRADEPAEAAQ